jgi:hypothetical protein
MDTTELTHPIFETNQVLSSRHLNDLFGYLDEQSRLTRANLIGIGIACGLDVTFEAPGTLRLSRGCGVTSQGYLIIEPADLVLTHARSYTLPDVDRYPPFSQPGSTPPQYELWELFPDDDEPNAVPLVETGRTLKDQAVVLFLERREDSLRNCSPNGCDDRGAQVTATVRRLLVDVADLGAVIAATSGLAPNPGGTDPIERLSLPDLRMPRFDVPATGPVGTAQVLRAYQETFRQNKLVETTATALTALYKALRPLVLEDFPMDPFTGFQKRFGFLDTTPVTGAQVRFLQYYWDFFDDLLAQYEEVRWKGTELICACCPSEELFPRHLMAGVLDPAAHEIARYRHDFIPSPAIGDCGERSEAVRQLFRRLVKLPASFTEQPPDRGVRVTPSRWGDAPMAVRAIPYYYAQTGKPPLYQLWDPVKTDRRRAHHNLGYRSDEYSPEPPEFVTDPLRFDLEPNDFLRIEGHLGLDVRKALASLLTLKKSHRLPFEVVALRTGAFDDSIETDLDGEDCRIQDLETLYDTLSAGLICFLVRQVQYFYGLPYGTEGEPITPTLWLLRTHSPTFVADPGTMGHAIELHLARRKKSTRYLRRDVIQDPWLDSVLELVTAMSGLAESLSDDVRHLDIDVLAGRFDLLDQRAVRLEQVRNVNEIDFPGLADRLDDILFQCRLDPFETLAQEYRRRVREVKRARFLGHFLEQHPGVQHKAGVPLGGTFIIVYHGVSQQKRETAAAPDFRRAITRLRLKTSLVDDPDVLALFTELTKDRQSARKLVPTRARDIYSDTLDDLATGSVVADFFLPYACCSTCPPIQFQLPPLLLQVNVSIACTDAKGFAEVTLTVRGASGQLRVQVDGGMFRETDGTLRLAAGDHTIVVRDDEDHESRPVPIRVPPQLRMGEVNKVVDQTNGTWHVEFTIEGGTPPYDGGPGTIVGGAFTSESRPFGEALTVTVKDTAGCTVEDTFESGVPPCDLPCGGDAVRTGHLFWLPEARQDLPISGYDPRVDSFVVTDPTGLQHDLRAEVSRIIVQAPTPITESDFPALAQDWLLRINEAVASALGSDQLIHLDYARRPKSGTTGALFVDRLTCVDFSFVLGAAFTQGGRKRELLLGYDSGGTVVVDMTANTQVRIPRFKELTSNKCRPWEKPVPVCKSTDLTLEFIREGVHPDPVVLTAKSSGRDQPSAFLWEVADGIPALADGESVNVGFDPVEPPEKLVRLTAFTQEGCAVLLEKTINILRDGG